ncbi:MAG: hypothetical protein K6F53_03810 [Lachnospiraceae bacterium]|nr:hypothetical protein [Lachnospiraceae bacterium]
MNIAIIPWTKDYEDDRMFDLSDKKLNRDDLMRPYASFRAFFEKRGDTVHTVDRYGDLTKVDRFLFFEFLPEWIVRLHKAGLDDRMIYCNAEPETVSSLHTKEGYGKLKKYFPYIMTWNEEVIDNERIFRRIIPYHFEDHSGNVPFSERKLLCNISGNKFSDSPKELYGERRRIIRYFEKHFPEGFGLYGTGWSSEEYPSYLGAPPDKFEVYNRYRFAVCLENTKNVRGYITEKIFDCLTAGIVPVYAGAENIASVVPKECFLDYNKIGNPEALSKILTGMSEEEYEGYLSAARDFLKSDIAKRLDGSVYASDIQYAIENGRMRGFRIEEKTILKLKAKILKARISGAVRKAGKRLLGRA